MAENTSMKTTENKGIQAPQGDQERVLRPPVDIYEDGTGITLRADLPGVSRDRLEIQVEGNNLVIEAQAALEMPEGMQPLYADVNATRFHRSFTLSNELETDKIRAEMKDGVLSLHLPKRAELQPRKIEIQ